MPGKGGEENCVYINIIITVPHQEGFIFFDQAAVLRKVQQWRWVETLVESEADNLLCIAG